MIRRGISVILAAIGFNALAIPNPIVSLAVFMACGLLAWFFACWASADRDGVWRVFP